MLVRIQSMYLLAWALLACSFSGVNITGHSPVKCLLWLQKRAMSLSVWLSGTTPSAYVTSSRWKTWRKWSQILVSAVYARSWCVASANLYSLHRATRPNEVMVAGSLGVKVDISKRASGCRQCGHEAWCKRGRAVTNC